MPKLIKNQLIHKKITDSQFTKKISSRILSPLLPSQQDYTPRYYSETFLIRTSKETSILIKDGPY